MRFFDINYFFSKFGGTITASSGTPVFAFNENPRLSWVSNLQATDGTSVYIEQAIASVSIINRIFISNTNISNLTIQVDIGAGYVALSPTKTIVSKDLKNYLYEFNNIAITKIKISGSNTLIANREKEIGGIYGFMELGQIKNFAQIQPKNQKIQKVLKLQFGKSDIINLGRSYGFTLKLKNHYIPEDNVIINTLRQQDEPFFIWINDGNDDVMKMDIYPYRFQDIYKVASVKQDPTEFANNMFYSGINTTLNMEEVY